MTDGRTPWQIALHTLIDRPEVAFDWERLGAVVEGRSIAITGAGGSIGSALAAQLAALGADHLLLIEHHEDSLFDLRRSSQRWERPVRARFALVDVRDQEALQQELRGCRPEILFHLAACKHVPVGEENPVAVVRVNLGGTLSIMDAAAAVGVRQLVFPSTDKAVYPPSVYGATKRAVELVLAGCRTLGAPPQPSIVRLVNTIGAQGGVIRTWAEQARAGQPLTLTDPTMTRYWISLREALGLLLTAADSGLPGPLVLDVGEPARLDDVARRTWQSVREDGRPAEICVVGARPGERRHEYLARADETLEPTDYPGVFTVLPNGGPLPHVLTQTRRLLADLPWDDQELRVALFDLIGEPLSVTTLGVVRSASAADA